MAIAQPQHGFTLEGGGDDAVAPAPFVLLRHRHHEGFVVQCALRQPGVGQGQGHDGGIKLALTQQFDQAGGEIFLQDQRHLWYALDHQLDQRRQQIGGNRVNHAQP